MIFTGRDETFRNVANDCEYRQEREYAVATLCWPGSRAKANANCTELVAGLAKGALDAFDHS